MYVILGAGITGLVLGYEFKKAGVPFLILEKSSRVGGWINTDQKTGFLFESGPRSFRTIAKGSPTLELVKELGLENELIRASSDAKKRLLFHQGALTTFKPWNRMILGALWSDLTTGSAEAEDESVEQFFQRRFGAAVAESFGDAVTTGIYAGDYKKLSMKLCFPKFWEWDQRHKGMLRGMFSNRGKKTGIFSFKEGMSTLTRKLEEELRDYIRLDHEVTALSQEGDGVKVTLADGFTIDADRLFSTIAPHQLAPITPAPLTEKLQTLSSNSVAVVHLGWKRPLLSHKAFGYLIPQREKQQVLGVVFDSCTFPEQNRNSGDTRLTVMMGGANGKALLDQSSDTLLDTALEAIQQHLDITEAPDASLIRIARNAIPQYDLDYETNLRQIEELQAKMLPSLVLLGSGFNGVSINDCILHARRIGGAYVTDPLHRGHAVSAYRVPLL